MMTQIGQPSHRYTNRFFRKIPEIPENSIESDSKSMPEHRDPAETQRYWVKSGRKPVKRAKNGQNSQIFKKKKHFFLEPATIKSGVAK